MSTADLAGHMHKKRGGATGQSESLPALSAVGFEFVPPDLLLVV